MKRHSNQHQLRLITEISVTPLMDLVLVLLLVFLLTAPLLKGDKSLPLPVSARHPAPAAIPAPVDVVTLTMNRDLSVTLNGAMLARADLPASLKQLAQRQPGLGVEVRMYRDLPVQQLVETMEMLEQAGIRKTTVTTHMKEP